MEINHAVVLFREYMGPGLIVIWFLVCLLYLFLKEERKQIRILFVYVPVIILLLFFNPLFARIIEKFMGDEIYYRVLWLLPITVVIAYTCISVCAKISGNKRMVFAGVSVLMMVVSGNYIYDNVYFTEAENIYHMPEGVVHICDAIEIPGREVTAVFPLEMIQYVRQYSPVVCMPYGREILAEGWNDWAVQHDLCDAMEAEVVDATLLGTLAKEDACIYIILSEDKPINGSLAETGYEVFLQTDGYVVYRNPELITF